MLIILLELLISIEKSLSVQFFNVIKITTLQIYEMYEKTIARSLFWGFFFFFSRRVEVISKSPTYLGILKQIFFLN